MRSEIETVGTTGRWLDPRVPKSGWVCVEVDKDSHGTTLCDMCETHHIAYKHRMKHDKYPMVLEVGCVCAGYMLGNLEEAKQKENQFKRILMQRLAMVNLSSREWKETSSGLCILIQKYKLTVCNNHSGAFYATVSRGTKWRRNVWHVGGFQTLDEAKAAAIACVQSLAKNKITEFEGHLLHLFWEAHDKCSPRTYEEFDAWRNSPEGKQYIVQEPHRKQRKLATDSIRVQFYRAHQDNRDFVRAAYRNISTVLPWFRSYVETPEGVEFARKKLFPPYYLNYCKPFVAPGEEEQHCQSQIKLILEEMAA